MTQQEHIASIAVKVWWLCRPQDSGALIARLIGSLGGSEPNEKLWSGRQVQRKTGATCDFEDVPDEAGLVVWPEPRTVANYMQDGGLPGIAWDNAEYGLIINGFTPYEGMLVLARPVVNASGEAQWEATPYMNIAWLYKLLAKTGTNGQGDEVWSAGRVYLDQGHSVHDESPATAPIAVLVLGGPGKAGYVLHVQALVPVDESGHPLCASTPVYVCWAPQDSYVENVRDSGDKLEQLVVSKKVVSGSLRWTKEWKTIATIDPC